MIRYLAAAIAAFALVAASPALACDDCKNCPHAKVAQADTKKEGEKPKATKDCGCTSAKDCKCKEGCKCAHCGKHEKTEGAKT